MKRRIIDGMNDTHRHRLRDGLLPAAVLLTIVGCSSSVSSAADTPEFMLVQISEGLRADSTATTLRLLKVSPQVVYFSDRPNRIAGHLTMAQFLEEWTAATGLDNLSADPPNATLSVYEPGHPENTIAIVELTDPRVDGADFTYRYKLIEGEIPASGGATALFIDKIGVGGGVGVGYHGVGVGARGPGVR